MLEKFPGRTIHIYGGPVGGKILWIDLQPVEQFLADRKPGSSLNFDDLLQMGLNASVDTNGNANLQAAFLTIHNVVRLLARPEQWTGSQEPGQYGHRPDDPMYPVWEDLAGEKSSSSDGETLPALLGFKARRGMKREVYEAYVSSQSSSILFNPAASSRKISKQKAAPPPSQPLETLTITGNARCSDTGSVRTSFSTLPGEIYLIKASGLIVQDDYFESGRFMHTSQHDPLFTWNDASPNPFKDAGLQLSGGEGSSEGLDEIMGSVQYSQAHIYTKEYQGNGRPIMFCYDWSAGGESSLYRNHRGEFIVRIYGH